MSKRFDAREEPKKASMFDTSDVAQASVDVDEAARIDAMFEASGQQWEETQNQMAQLVFFGECSPFVCNAHSAQLGIGVSMSREVEVLLEVVALDLCTLVLRNPFQVATFAIVAVYQVRLLP
jgi:hypothetical protein